MLHVKLSYTYEDLTNNPWQVQTQMISDQNDIEDAINHEVNNVMNADMPGELKSVTISVTVIPTPNNE